MGRHGLALQRGLTEHAQPAMHSRHLLRHEPRPARHGFCRSQRQSSDGDPMDSLRRQRRPVFRHASTGKFLCAARCEVAGCDYGWPACQKQPVAPWTSDFCFRTARLSLENCSVIRIGFGLRIVSAYGSGLGFWSLRFRGLGLRA